MLLSSISPLILVMVMTQAYLIPAELPDGLWHIQVDEYFENATAPPQ